VHFGGIQVYKTTSIVKAVSRVKRKSFIAYKKSRQNLEWRAPQGSRQLPAHHLRECAGCPFDKPISFHYGSIRFYENSQESGG
jgi:hypothetical protein